jgi:adenylate cyclase
MGDAIMALYGAPLPMENQALKAIKSAILMIEKLYKWNEEQKEKKGLLIEIGIGIHTGVVVAGNMGAESRLNYTVLGAAVNFASRLCSAAGAMEIRVSKECLASSKIEENLNVKELEPILYKGFSEPVVTYAVTGFKAHINE